MKYNIDPLDEDIQEYDIDDFAIDADISDSTRIETEQNIENEGLLAHFAYYFNYFLYSCYINYLIIKESLYTKGTHLYNHIDTIMHTKLHKI
ncbi:MAG TPA: hypothetical protein VGW78_02200 [Candidatus Babeliales bacterium]|nr:hypothetical protein [Candidatus Babeliales bacterium]